MPDQQPTPEIAQEELSADLLQEIWPILTADQRVQGFGQLSREEADDFFQWLSPRDQAKLIRTLPPRERRIWMRTLAPDDAVDVLQEVEEPERAELLALLDDTTRADVLGLLSYAEDAAGGLMSPRFARVRPEATVDEAIRYLRRQFHEPLESVYYAYALDRGQHLLGVVSFRTLFTAPSTSRVSEVMHTKVISVSPTVHQRRVARLMTRNSLMALPVVDAQGCMQGIVTADDVMQAMQEDVTRDMQRMGGLAALERPYMYTGLLSMVRKRGGWLAVLFLGELLTASAMGYFEAELARAVVLALFIPLIISSGGNAGSQATTLIIRAMALGEVRIAHWWLVLRRELAAGLALGAVLAVLGLLRIVLWQGLFGSYGEHFALLAATVGLSLIGVVAWGTMIGSMLPFLLRRLKLDPATASAPFVATLVDVFGVVIYFGLAQVLLRGTLL